MRFDITGTSSKLEPVFSNSLALGIVSLLKIGFTCIQQMSKIKKITFTFSIKTTWQSGGLYGPSRDQMTHIMFSVKC